jgi:two-component system, OmpR family, phosphate regulon sensor histidine kinase PhoR
MGLRTHHKLFLSYSLLVAAVVIVLTLGVEATLRRPMLDQAALELTRELALGREIYDGRPRDHPDILARHLASLTGHRVTIVARDGTVLGESDVPPGAVAHLENHRARFEIESALAEGTGTAVRRSVSIDTDLLYAAMTTDRGDLIRFAVGIEQIDAAVARVRRQILQVGGVALLLAAVFSLLFSLAVTRPLRRMRRIASSMAAGDLDARVRPFGSDELAEMGRVLDTLAGELQRRLGQLEAERAGMTALIDSMQEGVLAIHPDGIIRRANPAARRMVGRGTPIEGSRPEALVRRRPFLDLVRQALDGEPVQATEITHDGSHLLATAQPLPGGGAVLVLLDTSELRRLEGVRRDFVANASHELKTPLTAIRGYAETLLGDDVPDDLRRRFTETIHANATRLQNILDDLLDLSKIESGGWPLEPRPIHVAEVAEEAWQPFTEDAAQRGIAFHCRDDAHHPAAGVDADRTDAVADPMALRQIFTNLFSNAIRYTPPGGRITVTTRPAPGDIVQIEVADTGSGIPAEHLGRIFERFYRADPARSRAEGGTGLGLAIVRHLVERHGGRIEAESELGQGTTIRFTFPATKKVFTK